MIFATHFPYFRQRHTFTAADQMGSAVAHSDLASYALLYGVVDAVHLYGDAELWPDPDGIAAKTAEAALAELRERFGTHRVGSRQTQDLTSVVPQDEYIYVTKAPYSVDFSQIRSAMRKQFIPSCSIMHSVSWQDLLRFHISLLCLQEQYDALVATSRAAQHAFESIEDEVVEILESRLQHQFIRQRVTVKNIPLAIDPTTFGGCPKTLARQVLQLVNDGTYLLYFGRLSERYKADLEPLLRVFARLRREFPTLRLIVAGYEGSEQYRFLLTSIAADLALGDSITFMVNIPPFLKQVVYSAADIFVAPVDNIQESFGIALLEAMASHVPVVASNWSGYRDIVEDGRTGLLVRTVWADLAKADASWQASLGPTPHMEHLLATTTAVDHEDLASKLRLLITNSNLRNTLAEAAYRQVCCNFSWAAVSRQYEDLWKWQIREGAHRPEAHRQCHIDYDRAFAHYASACLQSTVTLCRTPRGDKLVQDSGNEATRVPRGFDPALVAKTLTSCATPVSVEQVLRETKQNNTGLLCWLLKKGAIAAAEWPAGS